MSHSHGGAKSTPKGTPGKKKAEPLIWGMSRQNLVMAILLPFVCVIGA